MAFPILAALPLVGKVFDYFSNKSEHKAKIAEIKQDGEIRIEQAKVESNVKIAESGAQAASSMDQASTKDRGWKDEYLLFVITIPIILSFIPQMVHYVQAGFEALKQVPEWYMWALLGVYIDTFGFRRIMRVAMSKYIEARFGK